MLTIKQFILLAAFIVSVPSLLTAQFTGFQKIFGDTEKRAVGVASVNLNDEFIFLVGYESSDGDDTQGTLSKLDLEGNLFWTYRFGTRDNDIPRNILFNDKGEIVVVGETQANGASQVSAFVFVFDTSGIELWSEKYNDDYNNIFFNSIKQTTDRGYIICGYITGQGFGNDYYIVKIDEDGDVEWDQTYGGLNNEVGMTIEVLEDGSYVFVGDKQQSAQGPYGIEMMGIDSVGDIKWQSDINDFTNGGVKSMIRNKAGNLFVVGEATPPNRTAFDVFLTEVRSDGQLVWQRFIDASPQSDAGFGIMEIPNESGYMVTGYGFNETTDDTDIMVSQLDPSGVEQHRQYYENPGPDIGYDIKPTDNGSFIVTGVATQNNKPKYFLALDNYLSTSTQEIMKGNLDVQLFPNPVSSESYTLRLSHSVRDAKVRIIHPSGKVISETYSDLLESINLNGLTKGVYWISIQTENGFTSKKIVRF